MCVMLKLVILVSKGWMDDLWITFCSTVFQSYQNDGLVIITGCVQRDPVYDRKDPRLKRGSNPRPLGQ